MLRAHKPHWPYTINRDSPQSVGLVSWWPGVGAPNKILDLAGMTSPAPANGTFNTAGTPTWVAGLDGGQTALKFDQTSGHYVNCGSVRRFNSDGSMAVWAKFPDTTNYHLLLAQGDSTNGTQQYLGYRTDVAAMIWTVDGSTYIGTKVPTVNVWYHLVGTYKASGTALTLYVNGVQNATGTAPADFSGVSVILTMGSNSAGTIVSGATIEDMRMYNRVLSAAEVWAMYDPATRWQLRYQGTNAKYFFNQFPGGTLGEFARIFLGF